MQPTKEEMLSKIYEAVSDKELRFGCIMDKVRRFRFLGKDYNEDGWTGRYRGMDDGENVFTTTITGSKVIGNPVMIGDVLKWIEENYRMNYNLGVLFSKEGEGFAQEHIADLLNIWKLKHLSIEGQSNECIMYIYTLIIKSHGG